MSERVLLTPFGPKIAKVKMPEDLVKKLNNYIDKIIEDKKKSSELDIGDKLAGNVTEEFQLENNIVQDSGWLNFLGSETAAWIKNAENKKITKFNLIKTWVVRQYQTEYNPIHTHEGHISGVGYLKVPPTFGETVQKNKLNLNGSLNFVHGSRMFLCRGQYSIVPQIGDFYFFPAYLMHSVYPFNNTDEERRSVSFNARVDDEIFNSLAN